MSFLNQNLTFDYSPLPNYSDVELGLAANPRKWAITGVAGFIGSNILERLLMLDQFVVGLDNFVTGHEFNLEQVRLVVGSKRWSRFRLLRADICDLESCRMACNGTDIVLHHAALGSVPRSLKDPIATNQCNIGGFLNMLVAAKDTKVQRFVYAASSSTYGDCSDLPKQEDRIGRPLSPYAVTKLVNELYADVFAKSYGLGTVGLRYFNVFGPRQDPNGEYAAVIPVWISKLLQGAPVQINGDGNTSRDFCYIRNVIQANILAGTTNNPEALNQVFNIAVGNRTSLMELFNFLRARVAKVNPEIMLMAPDFKPFRPGDVLHSQADITKARTLLGYDPTHSVFEGLEESLDWYIDSRNRIF